MKASSAPLTIASFPTDSVPCPQCAQANPAEETYCVACGAALQDDPVGPVLPPLAAGTVVGDYLIETVEPREYENRYRAVRHDDVTRRVVLRERASADAESFCSLIEWTADIVHPALIVPECYLEHDDRAYLVSPEVAGIHLSLRIDHTSEREVVAWGIQLCQIFGFLHRHNLFCPELPPDNVLLDKEGRLRLPQLDSIRAQGASLETLAVTDGYAAPELYKSGEGNEQAEVFAVGALLYSLLVGKRLPVEGWIVQPEPPVFYPDKVVSPALERILRRAVAFDVEDRYPTVEALKAALLGLPAVTRISSASRTDVGQRREHNEDAVLVSEQGHDTITGHDFCGLYVVSDGMGGAEAGEIAAMLTIQSVARSVAQAREELATQDEAVWTQCLQTAVERANEAILAHARAHPETTGLGATVVAALVRPRRLTLAWVGDSRVYLWERGQLVQLSRDHSLVARLVEIGQLTPQEASTHEHRNVLIRSLGNKEQVTVDTLSRPLRRGARLLLCSDGLTSHVEDHALADILSRHRDPADAARELVVAANTGGGSDNISVVVVFHE